MEKFSKERLNDKEYKEYVNNFFSDFQGFFPSSIFNTPMPPREYYITTKNIGNRNKEGEWHFENLQKNARDKNFMKVIDDFVIKVPEVKNQLAELKKDLETIAKIKN